MKAWRRLTQPGHSLPALLCTPPPPASADGVKALPDELRLGSDRHCDTDVMWSAAQVAAYVQQKLGFHDVSRLAGAAGKLAPAYYRCARTHAHALKLTAAAASCLTALGSGRQAALRAAAGSGFRNES